MQLGGDVNKTRAQVTRTRPDMSKAKANTILQPKASDVSNIHILLDRNY